MKIRKKDLNTKIFRRIWAYLMEVKKSMVEDRKLRRDFYNSI
ncbi:unnamed protein product [marine sediment metagenome]|uniref:Uncharacterized protein n=1 Tax=marine sediment metagenome TaxID=412755 RepID=X1KQJ3_9ZZZZ